jgi:hypothetical protein
LPNRNDQCGIDRLVPELKKLPWSRPEDIIPDWLRGIYDPKDKSAAEIGHCRHCFVPRKVVAKLSFTRGSAEVHMIKLVSTEQRLTKF